MPPQPSLERRIQRHGRRVGRAKRSTLAATAALGLVVTGACGGGGGKSTAKRSATTATSTTTTASTLAGGAAANSATTTTGVAAPPTTAAPTRVPAAATVNGRPTTAYQPPAGAQPAAPPAPGTYRYDTSGSSTFGGSSQPFPAVTSLRVDPAQGPRQHSVRDLRDPSGNGSYSDTWLQYQPQGVLLEELKITTVVGGGGFTDVRDFKPNPPALVAPTGAKPGDHVDFDVSGSGIQAHVHVDVLRHEPVVIGGQSLDTLVARVTTTFSGDVSGTSTADGWLSPQYRLTVKEHSVSDISSRFGKAHSDYTAVMQRVTPS